MSGHALVTGGGSGIGRAIAIALVDAGWRVTILGRGQARLDAVKAERPAIAHLACDVGDDAAIEAAIGAIGAVDALIHCAGDARAAEGPDRHHRQYRRAQGLCLCQRL
jgi:NAD(P)-dependent dehydrogenase (short-subunit alcohol dehydrogenase family)